MSDEWSGDINVVASVLKQWFRELPEPLLTHALYQGFIDAARESMPTLVFTLGHSHADTVRLARLRQ
jgi:hypothetical protein